MQAVVAASAIVFSSGNTAWFGQGRRTRKLSDDPSTRMGYNTLKPPMINGVTKVADSPNILLANDSTLRHVDVSLTCFTAFSQSSSLRSHARLSESCRASILDRIEYGNEGSE